MCTTERFFGSFAAGWLAGEPVVPEEEPELQGRHTIHVLVIALQHAGRGMRTRISMPAAVLVVNPLDLGDVFEK